jgi:hypothetical protein
MPKRHLFDDEEWAQSESSLIPDPGPLPTLLTPFPSAPTIPEETLYFLLHAYFISGSLTTDIRPDLKAYKRNLKFTNPYNVGDFETQVQYEAFNASTEDFWHIPLFSMGGPDNNGMFVRVSVCHKSPQVLFISCRPLMLDGIEELVRKGMFDATLKFVGLKSTKESDEKSTDNIIDIVHNLHRTDIEPSTGMSSGYHEMVNMREYTVMYENEQDKVLRRYGIRLPRDYLSTERSTMSNKLVEFISDNSHIFTKVVYTGFSLGAGTSLACASSVHDKLSAKGISKSSVCVQLAGTTVGTTEFAARVKSQGIHTYYVALENSDLAGIDRYDPVSYMPFNLPDRVHIADWFIVLDFTQHTIVASEYNKDNVHGKIGSSPLSKLVASYLTGQNWGGGYLGFMKTHLAGEGMIARVIMKEITDRGRMSKWLSLVPCEFYTLSGTAAKCRVCPQKQCDISVKRSTDQSGHARDVTTCTKKRS